MSREVSPWPLFENVATLHPWPRARICTISVQPLVWGGWGVDLAYLTHTTPRDSEAVPACVKPRYPLDTSYPINLAGPDPGVAIREFKSGGEMGTLHASR